MTYISVPIPAWEPVAERPPRATGIIKPPAPEGAGVGGGASLVQYKGLTDTIQKQPSEICLAALEKLEALPYDAWQKQYEQTCQDFYEYQVDCSKKGFVLKGYDVKKGEMKRSYLDYDNRWMPRYRKDLSRKLNRLEAWFNMQADRPVTMITLTSYHEGITIPSAWFELNQSRTKLLKLIRKYFGDVDYFWVVEPHKSGYVHYHLAVFADVSNNKKDNKGKGIEDKFRDLWSKKYKTGNHTYGLDFSQKKGDDKLKSLKDYLSKYLRKSFLLDDWSVGMLLFNAHLWSTGFRAYGASKRVSEIMRMPEQRNKDVVWLETTYQDLQKIPETGEKIETERILWYRQYIPDWLDWDIWSDYFQCSWIQGTYYEWWTPCNARQPDDTVKCGDWGRRQKRLKGYDPTHGGVKPIGINTGQTYR